MSQPSMPGTAVLVRNAVKTYPGSKEPVPVLNHLNMTVKQGSIYGLLGASGCGKTTLLGCITGRLKIDTGDISVLGGVPGTKDSGVPGPRIGYMPQEAALVHEFNVREQCVYFGWLHGMRTKDIAERFAFLSQLLDLPPNNRLIKHLSGGETRRVSFAAALIQTPELLILDEPTVGLDPVLRHSIWNYLVELSNECKMTIILTTHYIEEARQAHKVGLMRGGTLLAETSPDQLILQHNCSTLEEVFLILSRKQEDHDPQPIDEHDIQPIEDSRIQNDCQDTAGCENVESAVFDEITSYKPEHKTKSLNNLRWHRMSALLYKHTKALLRDTGGLVFVFLFPIVEITLFYLTIGGNPHHLPLAIVNDELGNCNNYIGNPREHSAITLFDDGVQQTCHFRGLSCLFMAKLNSGVTINEYYDDTPAALEAAKRGTTHGVVHFPRNFSAQMETRVKGGFNISNEQLEDSQLTVWLDMSNHRIALMLQKYLYDTYAELAVDIADACQISVKQVQVPVKFNDPIYGTKKFDLTAYIAPGFVLSAIFFLALMFTSTVISIEKTEGIWNRNIVAGVTTFEMLASHLIVECTAMIIPISEMLLICVFVFDMQMKGSAVAVVAIIAVQSLAGSFYGLVISVMFENMTVITYIAMGTILPYMILGGHIWPLEGMPVFLQYISSLFPGTVATASFRDILERGWAWYHPRVWQGYAIPLVWVVVFGFISIVMLRRERK